MIPTTTRVGLIASVIVLAGCQQFYNGWPASRSAQPEPTDAAQRQPADSAGPSAMHFAGPTGTARPATQPAATPTGGRGQTRSMQLWGQLAGGSPAQWRGVDAARNVNQVSQAGEGADFDPAVNPDDGTIVFASTRHRRTADLYRKHPDGHALTQLTSDPANDLMPTVSPDGQHIAFASDRSGNWDLYLMNASGGGKVVRLTDSSAHDLHPSFSPDGQRLVYSSYSQRVGQWQLVVRRLDSPGSRQILGEGLFPTWAPDSDRILYQRARQRGTRWFSLWQVRYNDGQAGAPTELASSHKAALINPSWGPKGERIVFCTVSQPTADAQGRPREADLWMMAADGGHHTRLTGGRFANLQPVWSETGTIFFVSNRSKQRRDSLWSLQPRGPMQAQGTGGSDPAEAEASGESADPAPEAEPSSADEAAQANAANAGG
jgi:TolB protein